MSQGLNQAGVHEERPLSSGPLSFPPEFEARFEAYGRGERAKRFAREGLIALAIYCLSILVDSMLIPGHLMRALVIRFVVIAPISFAGVLYAMTNPERRVREALACVLSCVASFSILFIYAGGAEGVSQLGQFSVLLVALMINVVFRVYFQYAVAGTFALLAMDALFLYFDPTVHNRVRFIAACSVGMGAALTVFANYSLNREARMAYLLQLESEQQREELHKLSNLDRLTNIANRRRYEAQFEKLWTMAADANAPLSLIMIDIDQFKSLNDQFGHPYGDLVLRAVALTLDRALRSQADMVARYGGEEFVVLLPDTPGEAALLAAERMRLLVQNMTPPTSETAEAGRARSVTISAGVATIQPMEGDLASRRQALVQAADRALYRAKAAGRNQVCRAEEQSVAMWGSEAALEMAAGIS